jgi:diadenosine tetraphosphate (Ap4A) HIT family hydrolase
VTWFIIVPDTHHIEWYELDLDFQEKLNNQVNIISKLLTHHFNVDKINIATIGNVVSQMHLHVVGRKKTDPFWPDVVWGKKESQEYREDQLNDIAALIRNSFREIA